MAEAKPVGYDKVAVLGDLVGYGADPNAIIERMRDLQADGPDPRQPRQGRLRRREPRRLQRRRAQRHRVDLRRRSRRTTAMARGTARRARLSSTTDGDLPWHAVRRGRLRLRRSRRAARAACGDARPLCLFGHTHVPMAIYLSRDHTWPSAAADQRPLAIQLDDGNRYLVNPGAVGQPRDGDARAALRLLDPTCELK